MTHRLAFPSLPQAIRCPTTSVPSAGNSTNSSSNCRPSWRRSSGASRFCPAPCTPSAAAVENPPATVSRASLHASTVLSYRGQGRPQNITPPPEHLSAVRRLTDDYRQFRQARTQLLQVQRQILKLIDGIEAARVQEGERRFQKLRATFPPHSRR